MEYSSRVIKPYFFTFVPVLWNFTLLRLISERRKPLLVERDQTSLTSLFSRREIWPLVWEGQFQRRVQWPGGDRVTAPACWPLENWREKKKNEEEYLKVTWPLFREQKRCNDADVTSTQLMSGAALFTFTDPRWIASRLRSSGEQLMSQLIYVCVPSSLHP